MYDGVPFGYDQEVQKLQEIIDDSQNIVFFGGAGVSTESNIPDFRSADGLYHQKYKYSPEQVVSHSFFMQYPDAFYEFYKEKMMLLDAKPNPAHLKLAELERAGKLLAIVTQNIDGLHQAAGSKTVYELHGSIHRNYCMNCHKFYDAKYVKNSEEIPKCECGGTLKPDVVLYEEGLDSAVIQGAVRAISSADTLIIGGTSLVVYPAAGFIDYFQGKHLVVINKSDTAKIVRAELSINAPIGEILGRIHS
ncbi:MAG: NAD-dependent protein deacylase [Hespellia sp.]|nr:NAD-dependent protein deacylase [Hespellia sp.]